MDKENLLSILYPRRCPVCGKVVEGEGRLICPSCIGKFSPVSSPVCKKCGKEIYDETLEFCKDCGSRYHAFDHGMALYNYDETARRSISQIKYDNRREYIDFFAYAIALRYADTIRRLDVDGIVPVPIHPSRKRKRGFNQAEILAYELAEKLGLAVYPDMIVRDKKTIPQKDLTASERAKNLKDAFRPGVIPDGVRKILIVDDIYTTGATMDACAGALKDAGVEKVYFVVIAMTGGR